MDSGNKTLQSVSSKARGVGSAIIFVLITGALHSICVFVPFIAFQAYGYYNICLGRSVEETRSWCKARIPLLYNFIQSHYWGLGFLRYFQLKQLPNFLLAFPILSLAVCSIIYYAKLRREVFLSIGFRASPVDKKSAAVFFSVGAESSSNSEFVLEKETTKISEEDRVLRQRKQNIKGEDPATLSLDSDSTHNKQGYLSASNFILSVLSLWFHGLKELDLTSNLLSGSILVEIASLAIGYVEGKRRSWRSRKKKKKKWRKVVVEEKGLNLMAGAVVLASGFDSVVIVKPSSLLVRLLRDGTS
ncbi:hypothetical protein LguiB_021087 [Lonicera macranthoides]